jgi:hypothetical protein
MAAIAHDPDVVASSLLAFGSPLWKVISNISNVDFLLSINEQKFALLFEFLESTGWFLIMLVGLGWFGLKYIRSDWRVQEGSPTWGLATAIGLMAFLFGVLVTVRATGSVPNIVAQWSIQDGNCSTVVDTTKLVSFRKDYKLAMVCGVIDPLKDRQEDESIGVSAPFTIVPGGIPIIAPPRPAMAAVLQNNVQPHQIWFDPIILPNGISVDKIAKLSDVPRLGGKILRPQFFN